MEVAARSASLARMTSFVTFFKFGFQVRPGVLVVAPDPCLVFVLERHKLYRLLSEQVQDGVEVL